MLKELDSAVEQYQKSGLNFCEASVVITSLDIIDEIYEKYKVNSILIENMLMDSEKNVRCVARVNLDISDDKKKEK